LFSTYRLFRKRTTQTKNRIHPLLKENLYGFTWEEIFGKASRRHFHMAPASQRFGKDKDTASPVTPVPAINLFGMSRF
jgi:hypothetical protein